MNTTQLGNTTCFMHSVQARFALICIALGLLAIQSPSAVADGFSPKQALVGRWRMERTLPPSILILSADGTWAATVRSQRQPEHLYQVSGTWRADDRYIHWLYTNSTSPYSPPGTRDSDTFVEFGRDYFVIMSKSKARQRYVRVQ